MSSNSSKNLLKKGLIVPLSADGEKWQTFVRQQIDYWREQDIPTSCEDVFDCQFIDVSQQNFFRFTFSSNDVTDAFKRMLLKMHEDKSNSCKLYLLSWLVYSTSEKWKEQKDLEFFDTARTSLGLSNEEWNTFRPNLNPQTSCICSINNLPHATMPVRLFATNRFELQTFVMMGSSCPILERFFPL